MFAKLLLFLLVLFFVFVIGIGTLAQAIRRMLFGSRPDASHNSASGRFSSRSRFGNEEKAEHMLPCSVCGVHVPESNGVKADGKFFCCEAHRK